VSTEEPSEVLRDLLEEVAEGLGLDAQVDVVEEDGLLIGRVDGPDVGLLIGHHGQTIDAVQHIAQRTVVRDGWTGLRVTVDADGYRGRRELALRQLADDAAEEALRTSTPVELDAMPASERRIVHEHLRGRGDVATHSEGDEPRRYLVVSPPTP
jgi:spoIIIJ-associated protein